MFKFLILLFLIQNTGCTNSKSSLLNGSAKGSDAVNSGNPKVCFGLNNNNNRQWLRIRVDVPVAHWL